MENKPAIVVSGHKYNMQCWYEEKCTRALEELAHLSDTLRRPGDEPKGGWPNKKEEIEHHLFHAIKGVLVIASVSMGNYNIEQEDIDCIVDEGYTGYKKVAEKLKQ